MFKGALSSRRRPCSVTYRILSLTAVRMIVQDKDHEQSSRILRVLDAEQRSFCRTAGSARRFSNSGRTESSMHRDGGSQDLSQADLEAEVGDLFEHIKAALAAANDEATTHEVHGGRMMLRPESRTPMRRSYFSELSLMCWTYSLASSKSLREVVGSVT